MPLHSAIFCLLAVLSSITGHEECLKDPRDDSGSCEKARGRDVDVTDSYEVLTAKVASVLADCGEICDTSDEQARHKGKKYYDVLEKAYSCDRLFANKDIESNVVQLAMPPLRIPKFLLNAFTYDGRVAVESNYMNDKDGMTHQLVWPQSEIEKRRSDWQRGKMLSNYGTETPPEVSRHIKAHMRAQVEGGHVLVLGSQKPWLEALLLEHGAKHVTTIDYVPIKCDHPQVSTLTPEDLSQAYLDQSLPEFDAFFSFSSLEHSGLGRYGDDLLPYADLIAMAKAHCVLRAGGRGLIAVPTGPDRLIFNANRVYGPLQYAHLFANWKQVYTEAVIRAPGELDCKHCYQPIHIIEK